MSTMVNEDNGTNGTDIDNSSRPPRIAFLALIMVVSCAINCLLLYAACHSRQVRHSLQSITIVNLMVVCLADCFLNMTLVMGSLASGSDWTFGEDLCKWHAFLMNLVLTQTTLLLTVLACDRFLAIRFIHKYDSLISPIRLAIVILITWVQSLSFSIPFFFNTVKSTFRPQLHSCSVSEETSLVFICFASVLCFLAPAVIVVVMFVLVCHAGHRGQGEVKTIIAQNHYTDQLMDKPRLWQEMLSVKYVGIVWILWLILDMPYVITTYIQQYRFSHQLTFSVDYPWEVDVAFMWMRFTFSAVFPCVTFICKKNLWHGFKENMICHRNNSVLDLPVKPSLKPATKPPSAREVTTKSKERECKSKENSQAQTELPKLLSFNVPVLFATSEGIHIETAHSDSEYEETDLNSSECSVKGYRLDRGDKNVGTTQLPGETSDYDSNTEAGCSSSQKVSDQHVRGRLESCSLSDLASSNKGQDERGAPTPAQPFSSSQGTDSGLELSGAMSTGPAQQLDSKHDHSQAAIIDCSHEEAKPTDSNCVNVLPASSKATRLRSTVTKGAEKTCNIDATRDIENAGVDSSNVKCMNTDQFCSMHDTSIAGRRLEPLTAEKKTKTKAGRHKGPKSHAATGMGAGDNLKVIQTSSEGVVKSVCTDGQLEVTEGCRPAKAASAKGHRRSTTSDSAKALLGSSSSVEMPASKEPNSEMHPN